MSDGAIEYRHGWFWYHHFGVNWRDWGFGFSIAYQHRKEFGVYAQLGPMTAYATLEEEDHAFKDGVDQGFAIAPVDGYRNTQPTAPAVAQEEER